MLNIFKNNLTAPILFWLTTMSANVFNWVYNLQAGRILSKEDFAILSVFLSFQYLLTVPANALLTTVARFSAFYSERGEKSKYFYFFRQYFWLSWVLGFLFFASILVFNGPIQAYFGIDSSNLVLIFSTLLIPLFLISFEKGILSGQLAFAWIGVLAISEALSKLMFLLISPNLPVSVLTAAVLALPLSVTFAWVLSNLIGRSFHPLPSLNGKKISENNESYRFLVNSFFATLGVALIVSVDVLLVKHYFPAYEAGVFSTLSLLGKILYFGAGSLVGLLIPLTARAQARQTSGRKPFLILFSIVSLVGISIWTAYLLIPKLMVTYLLTERGLVTLPYLATYSLGMLFLVLVVCISSYNLARKNYLPSRLIIFASIIEAILIINFHSSLTQVVNIITATLFGLFLSVSLSDIFGLSAKSIGVNIISFLDLFTNGSFNQNSQKKRILIFNWRDIKHAHSGGAEVYIHQIAKKLVESDISVSIFTSNDGRNKRYESIDGVNIIRRGGFITVYIWAILYYIFKFRGKFDLIIDSENGIPFFMPAFVRKPIILLVHHVHQDVFFSSLLPPFSWIANFLESFLMPLIYKNATVVAGSKSTAEELTKINITSSQIITSGLDIRNYMPSKKTQAPQICYVGRLKKYKSIDVLLQAFDRLIQDIQNVKLIIAGEGDFRDELEKKTSELNLENVTFLGKISEKEKVKLLGQSWVMVQPSQQEGWGITCLEANACNTAVLASRVSGLKDSVSEGKSGYLFEYGNVNELYRSLKEIILNKKARRVLERSSRVWSEKFSWDLQAEKFNLLIKEILSKQTKSSLWLTKPLATMAKLPADFKLISLLRRVL